jgi:hypothetical protein
MGFRRSRAPSFLRTHVSFAAKDTPLWPAKQFPARVILCCFFQRCAYWNYIDNTRENSQVITTLFAKALPPSGRNHQRATRRAGSCIFTVPRNEAVC